MVEPEYRSNSLAVILQTPPDIEQWISADTLDRDTHMRSPDALAGLHVHFPAVARTDQAPSIHETVRKRYASVWAMVRQGEYPAIVELDHDHVSAVHSRGHELAARQVTRGTGNSRPSRARTGELLTQEVARQGVCAGTIHRGSLYQRPLTSPRPAAGESGGRIQCG